MSKQGRLPASGEAIEVMFGGVWTRTEARERADVFCDAAGSRFDQADEGWLWRFPPASASKIPDDGEVIEIYCDGRWWPGRARTTQESRLSGGFLGYVEKNVEKRPFDGHRAYEAHNEGVLWRRPVADELPKPPPAAVNRDLSWLYARVDAITERLDGLDLSRIDSMWRYLGGRTPRGSAASGHDLPGGGDSSAIDQVHVIVDRMRERIAWDRAQERDARSVRGRIRSFLQTAIGWTYRKQYEPTEASTVESVLEDSGLGSLGR